MKPTDITQQLRNAINDACPELLHLKFGCEILRGGQVCRVSSDLFVSDEQETETFLHTWDEKGEKVFKAVTKEFPPEEENGGDWEFAFSVLGTPPTLEHLLIAIRAKEDQAFIDFCENIWRTNLEINKQMGAYEDLLQYDLTKPPLNQTLEVQKQLLTLLDNNDV